MTFWRSLLIVATICSPAHSEEPTRFHVEGEKLFFNEYISFPNALDHRYANVDVSELHYYLTKNPQLTTLVLTGLGGPSEPAEEMAQKVALFGLNTEVVGRCESACTYIFLAGKERRLLKDAKLGFHRGGVKAHNIERGFRMHNDAPFTSQNVAEIYDRAISNALDDIDMMLQRGVSIDFALKVLETPNEDMWQPSRKELLEAGVLTHE